MADTRDPLVEALREWLGPYLWGRWGEESDPDILRRILARHGLAVVPVAYKAKEGCHGYSYDAVARKSTEYWGVELLYTNRNDVPRAMVAAAQEPQR